ncbi:(4Fe-4S)-binding protein [uncultured Kriegella sp.]|uniref:(4Fe-4S)-binding protein n=1 Tax=uncultured Kriegella sp. TaxID=1798910 RepID=UPI0030DB26AA|tara:strand:- start:16913 stop:17341 length:429 start_codon:yes stop_codon:yes gene_type:complete
MAEREITKKYTNEDLTVVWKPSLCTHSGICVNTLPEVYNPNEKPWIKAKNASVEALKSQIGKCPSGALSYTQETPDKAAPKSVETKVEALRNGPLLVHGELEVTHSNGHMETKKKVTAFCRCGASDNKPYCDGTHNSIAFNA